MKNLVSCDMSMFDYFSENTARLDDKNKTIVFYGKYIKKGKFIAEVDRLGGFFQSIGIKKGENIILCLGNIPNAVICFYAINKIGAIANVVHPLISSNNLEKIASDMDSKAFIVFDEFLSRYPWLEEQEKAVLVCSASDYLPCVAKQVYPLIIAKKLKEIDYNSKLIKYSSIKKTGLSSVPCKIFGDDTAVYMHSGGTSGQPKTVEMSNSAFNHLVENMLAHIGGCVLDDADGMLMALPIFHTFGLGICMHTILCLGGQCILMPKFDGKKACHLIKKYNCTYISGVPNMYSKIVNSGKFKGKKIAKIKSCFCGGDKLTKEVYDKFACQMNSVGRDLKISEGYGLTEACICAINKLDNYKFGSIGLAVKGSKFAVVDSQLNFLKPNEVGELALSCNTVMSRYYNDESATQETFFVDNDDVRWLLTGDMGYIDGDGFIFFVDRKKRLIKISGVNVFPQEIESVVNKVDGVRRCCVVSMQLNGKSFVKLFVQLVDKNADKIIIRQDIIFAIFDNLLKYCQPQEIEFIDEFPLTQIGKVDFLALQER